MTPIRRPAPALLRLLSLALALGSAAAAHADAYGEVQQLLKSGQGAQALQMAERYLADKPKDPQMRFLKGTVQSQSGDRSAALATFLALTQDYPELPEPYNNLAALYASQNELESARNALETALRMNPNYAMAHENLGDIYVRLASQSYRRAQALEPHNAQLGLKITHLLQLPVAAAKAPAQAKP